MIISSQLHTYGGQGWITCISGGTSCRFPGMFITEGLYLWDGEEKKGNSRFWIESDAYRVSFCFSTLDIVDILWNYIQPILGSL